MSEDNGGVSGDVPGEPAQFTLGSMMWFVFACSLYFSQFAAVFSAWNGRVTAVVMDCGLMIAWGLMIVFYLRYRSVVGILIHCWLPILLLFVSDRSMGIFAAGMWASTIISFPLAMLVLLFSSDRKAK